MALGKVPPVSPPPPVLPLGTKARCLCSGRKQLRFVFRQHRDKENLTQFELVRKFRRLDSEAVPLGRLFGLVDLVRLFSGRFKMQRSAVQLGQPLASSNRLLLSFQKALHLSNERPSSDKEDSVPGSPIRAFQKAVWHQWDAEQAAHRLCFRSGLEDAC